jgi:DNA repair exonuclease SbcCD nuclease subunit
MSKNVIKIAHAADIHVRGLQRHEEMQIIFDAYAKDIKEQNVDYSFFAGDIWHKGNYYRASWANFTTSRSRGWRAYGPCS